MRPRETETLPCGVLILPVNGAIGVGSKPNAFVTILLYGVYTLGVELWEFCNHEKSG